jgi:hypothetical protein
MMRYIRFAAPVSALLLIFSALFAAAGPDPAQASPTPVPLTPYPTSSPTPQPPTPHTVTMFPTITPSLTPSPTATQPGSGPALIPLTPGEPVNGVLPAGQFTGPNYEFTAQAGQVVVLQTTSLQVPVPGITLMTENGYYIGEANGSGMGSSVLVYTLPHTARYRAYVMSHSQSNLDIQYTLSLDMLTPQALTYGGSIESTMTPDMPARLYTFRGEAGDIVRVNLATWYFASQLVLQYANPDGSYSQLTGGFRSYATRDGGLQQIGPLVLPESGEYRVIANSLNMITAPGLYTLSLEQIEPAPLSYGETVEGVLTADEQSLYYAFDGAYGDIIDVQVIAEADADTVLHLYGGTNWQQLAFDDNSGYGLDPEVLGHLLNQDGMYIIEIRPYVSGDTTPFTLSLTRNADSLLDEGTRRVRAYNTTLSFEGKAGETMRMVVEVVQGVNTPNVIATQHDRTLFELTSTGLARVVTDFVVPQDGVVLVRLSASGNFYTETVADISVQPLDEADGQ